MDRDAVVVKRTVGYVPWELQQFSGWHRTEIVAYVAGLPADVDDASVSEIAQVATPGVDASSVPAPTPNCEAVSGRTGRLRAQPAYLHFAAVARPKGLRPAEEVVPKLGARPGLPVLRVGDVALYDRPLEQAAGHLDRAELDLPLRFFAARYGLVLCFALEPIDADTLGRELVRVSHPDGAIWLVVWKKPFARAGAPSWDDAQAAILVTGWVDNKILSLGDEVYATRFVRRRRPTDGAGTAGGSAAS